MNNGKSQPAWAFLVISILAFFSMAWTVAIQVTPPPIPENIPTSTAIYLAISTVICVVCFIAFIWSVLGADSRSAA